MVDDTPGRHSFVSFLSVHAWASVAEAGRSRTVPVGQNLFLQGDLTDHVLVITAGWVRVSTVHADGHVTLLALRGPGDIIGDAEAFSGEPRATSVTTLQEVRVLQLRSHEFRHVLTREPDVATALLRTLYARERESEETRREVRALDVAGRTAAYLVRLADRHGKPGPDGLTLTVPLTQQDVANHIAGSLRAVARTFATFRERGLVRTHRKRVIIAQPDVLRALAGLLPDQDAG